MTRHHNAAGVEPPLSDEQHIVCLCRALKRLARFLEAAPAAAEELVNARAAMDRAKARVESIETPARVKGRPREQP